MKIFLPLCLVVGVYLASPVHAQRKKAKEEPPLPSRTIQGTVLNVDGTPASKRVVKLMGLSRDSMRPDDNDASRFSFWDFRTNEAGKFTAQLGAFPTPETGRPGWGEYIFYVLPAEGDAGAVSARLRNSEDASGDSIADEWGPTEPVPPEGLDITLQIKTGVTVKGRVFEYPEGTKPLEGIEVTSGSDLHSQSHTGRGGEIFIQRTTTDAAGNFEITGIYPARFFLKVGNFDGTIDAPAHWLKSRLGDGPWLADALDNLAPAGDESILNLDIMAATEPLFACMGKVVDESGNAVESANVTFGISYHAKPENWDDHHGYHSTSTKSDGTFEILLPTPWIRGMSVEAEGFRTSESWSDDGGASLLPGKYDFRLHRADPVVETSPTESPAPGQGEVVSPPSAN